MEAIEYLQCLVGQSLCLALKSPDMDLYSFGFGKALEKIDSRDKEKEICTRYLHITCRFSVIWKTENQRVDKYYENTPCEKFHSEINRFIGLKVRRVALSDKNDLWLDFGDYWIVFATFESGEESWRFFTSDKMLPHLVASDCWLNFVE